MCVVGPHCAACEELQLYGAAPAEPKVDPSVTNVTFTDTDGDVNTFFTKDGKLIYQPRPGMEKETNELKYDAVNRRLLAAQWNMALQNDNTEVERVLAVLVKLAKDCGVPHNISQV